MNKLFLINKYCRHVTDSGSAEIQIILISFKINNIIIHLKINKKDNSCKRSLVKLFYKRYKLIKYLKLKNKELFLRLTKDLKLKFN